MTKKIAPEDQEAWKLLMRHFSAAATRRIEIAHGMVMGFKINDVERGVFLIPPSYNTGKTDMQMIAIRTKKGMEIFGQHYRYTSADIGSFTAKFAELGNWTRHFLSGFGGKHHV